MIPAVDVPALLAMELYDDETLPLPHLFVGVGGLLIECDRSVTVRWCWYR
jgi:hypothetical protein